MVYSGRPSAGCENCRKTKKRCDQGLPTCGRCQRLGKACGGYRDMNELMFRDQTSTVARRASEQSEAQAHPNVSPAPRLSPDHETLARNYFFEHFVVSGQLTFLETITPDEFLQKPILACSFVALANRERDPRGREMARRYYVETITATNAALQHPRRVRDDSTLIAVALLSVYERLNWEPHTSPHSWKHHVQGAAQVLRLRGRHQIRSKTGAALFRAVRAIVVTNAMLNEEEVPDYIVPWTQALPDDPITGPSDELIILASRVAMAKAAFRTGDKSDQELADLTGCLEADLLSWSERRLAAGSICSFQNIVDLDSPHSWNGTRHEYGVPQALRHWNEWRCLRILVSRVQEAIWRRSWPTLAQAPPSPAQYRATRMRMASDICLAAAYAFGNDSIAEPPIGSVASGYLLLMPLCLAGMCLLEQLGDPLESPGGGRMILVDEPLHLDPFNHMSTQLAWIIAKVDYVAEKIGIPWAGAVSRLLKGDQKVYYDIGRSQFIHDIDLEASLLSEVLDLTRIVEIDRPAE